jgi:NADPH oxidase
MEQFTITSAPKDPYISVHIRQVGDFTHALGERLGAGPDVVARMTAEAMSGADKRDSRRSRGDFVELDFAVNANLPTVRIDGPFGAPAEDVFNVQVAVLVGGGIGS